MSWSLAVAAVAVLSLGVLVALSLQRRRRSDERPAAASARHDLVAVPGQVAQPAPAFRTPVGLQGAFRMMNVPETRGRDFVLGHAAMGRRSWPDATGPREHFPPAEPNRAQDEDGEPLVPGMPGRPTFR